jgi:hypothetical protein
MYVYGLSLILGNHTCIDQPMHPTLRRRLFADTDFGQAHADPESKRGLLSGGDSIRNCEEVHVNYE